MLYHLYGFYQLLFDPHMTRITLLNCLLVLEEVLSNIFTFNIVPHVVTLSDHLVVLYLPLYVYY